MRYIMILFLLLVTPLWAADVVNRTTKQYQRSVNTPDFPVADWIINPDVFAVTVFPNKYWVITGDVITIMDQSARDAVDAAELQANRDATVSELDRLENVLRAFALVVLDEINVLRTQHGLSSRTIQQLKTGVRNKLGN